jgi:mono/diheme cytochrome c family protein
MMRTANEVLAIVREGIGQMPQVSRRELTDAQVLAIVDYLRSLPQP